MLKRALLFVSATLLLAVAVGCGGAASPAPTAVPSKAPTKPAAPSSPAASASPSKPAKTYSAPPQMTIDPKKSYTATLKTNMGDVKLQFFASEAPQTVNNFIFLAREGYYDGVKFHRVVKGFVIQAGDPTATGAGTPGYRFNDEPITRDYEPGTLAMANSGPNTNGSQFFITLADLKGRLPKNYTIFGKVADAASMEVVNKIGNVPTKAGPSGEPSSPTVDVHIASVTVEEGPAS